MCLCEGIFQFLQLSIAAEARQETVATAAANEEGKEERRKNWLVMLTKREKKINWLIDDMATLTNSFLTRIGFLFYLNRTLYWNVIQMS